MCISQNGELHTCRADDCRAERLEKAFDAAGKIRLENGLQQVEAIGRGHQQGQLRHAGNNHTPAGGITGIGKKPRHQQKADNGYIHQNRRKSRYSKALMHIQKGGIISHQCHAQQIRKGDARQLHGERKFGRLIRIARSQQIGELRHQDPGQRQHDHL